MNYTCLEDKKKMPGILLSPKILIKVTKIQKNVFSKIRIEKGNLNCSMEKIYSLFNSSLDCQLLKF